MWPHTTADDPTRYVNPEEKAEWEDRDPIDRMERYLAHNGHWDEETAVRWDTEIAAEVAAAFETAGTYPPPGPGDIYEHVFAEPTGTLSRQRRWHLGD